MDSARWQRIEEIFHTVVDVPEGPARESTLTALCGTDEALARLVRELLVEEDQLRVVDAVADPHIGLRLGNYQVDALIARGGMASVYSAHRADETFQQRVAIKIMDLRLSEPALVAQFKAERQILAALEHPALTRLLDGGVTGFGEPYLVMEYVEGEPIHQYCDGSGSTRGAHPALYGGLRRRRVRASQPGAASRPQTLEHPGHGRRPRQGCRLRHRDAAAPGTPGDDFAAPLTPAYASPEQLTAMRSARPATSTASGSCSISS